MPYRTITRFLGESEIYSAWELLLDSSENDEKNYIKDARGNIYNLSDFMSPRDGSWYHGYMSSGIDGVYLIKINKNNDIIKIFFQYIIYIPEKMVKVKERI